MKNLLNIAVGAMVFAGGTAFTQETTVVETSDFARVVVGARFMPTVSSFKVQSSDGVTQADFTLGYGFGGLLGINFNKHVGAQLEFQYNKLSQKYVDRDLNKRIHVDYVNIPILLSLNTNKMAGVNLNFVAGPQFGINVGASVTPTGTSADGQDFRAILAVKDNDFGIAYGFGIDFGLNEAKTFRLDLGFRGVQGLIDVSDRSRTVETDQYYILQKSFIRTYSIYAGLAILL